MRCGGNVIYVAGGCTILLLVAVLWVVVGRDSALDRAHSDDPAERLAAMRELGDDDSAEATQALIGAANDVDERVACQAVAQLTRRARPRHVKVLTEAAKDSRPVVREAAVAGMGQFHLRDEVDPRVLTRVLRGEREQPNVRAAAARALGRLQLWDGMPALVEALEHPDPLVRGRAGAAIRKMLGRDYLFRANDPLEKRREAIANIRRDWRGFKRAHELYVRRLKEKQK